MLTPLSIIPTQRTEDWWLQRHQQKLNERQAFLHDLDILFLGDSITHAWEVEGENTWKHHFAHLKVHNLGFAGDRTEHLLWRIQNGEIDSLSPKFTVLLIGTNNAGHRHDAPDEIAAGIKVILDELKIRMPHSKILLMAIFPRSRDIKKRMRKRVDNCNDIIQHYANQQQIVWLNINQQFLSDEGVLLESVMPDLLHPNSQQYVKWAKAVITCIEKE